MANQDTMGGQYRQRGESIGRVEQFLELAGHSELATSLLYLPVTSLELNPGPEVLSHLRMEVINVRMMGEILRLPVEKATGEYYPQDMCGVFPNYVLSMRNKSIEDGDTLLRLSREELLDLFYLTEGGHYAIGPGLVIVGTCESRYGRSIEDLRRVSRSVLAAVAPFHEPIFVPYPREVQSKKSLLYSMLVSDNWDPDENSALEDQRQNQKEKRYQYHIDRLVSAPVVMEVSGKKYLFIGVEEHISRGLRQSLQKLKGNKSAIERLRNYWGVEGIYTIPIPTEWLFLVELLNNPSFPVARLPKKSRERIDRKEFVQFIDPVFAYALKIAKERLEEQQGDKSDQSRAKKKHKKARAGHFNIQQVHVKKEMEELLKWLTDGLFAVFKEEGVTTRDNFRDELRTRETVSDLKKWWVAVYVSDFYQKISERILGDVSNLNLGGDKSEVFVLPYPTPYTLNLAGLKCCTNLGF